MSFSLTALQLVNKVRRRMRHPDAVSISELRDLATLDAVNRAMRYVTLGRVWESDKRHMQIITKARKTGVSWTSTAGQASALLNSAEFTSGTEVFGDFILRTVPKGASEYGNTAFRGIASSVPSSETSLVTFNTQIPDAISITNAEVFYSEYILADTVRSVLSVTYQEEPLTVEQVGATKEFAELYPRQQIEYGAPVSVSVGGLDIRTYNISETPAAPSLRMIVWPPPDDEYVLDVEYVYRHPELTEATSTLDGVTDEIVDAIVDMATADMQQNYDRNVDEGRAMMADSRAKMEEVHKSHGGQVAERAVIGNWDGEGSRHKGRHTLVGGRTIGE